MRVVFYWGTGFGTTKTRSTNEMCSRSQSTTKLWVLNLFFHYFIIRIFPCGQSHVTSTFLDLCRIKTYKISSFLKIPYIWIITGVCFITRDTTLTYRPERYRIKGALVVSQTNGVASVSRPTCYGMTEWLGPYSIRKRQKIVSDVSKLPRYAT